MEDLKVFKNLLVFAVKEFYLIEVTRFELIIKLGYESIKTVYIDENNIIRFEFNKKVNGKMKTYIKVSRENREIISQKILKLFRQSLDVEK